MRVWGFFGYEYTRFTRGLRVLAPSGRLTEWFRNASDPGTREYGVLKPDIEVLIIGLFPVLEKNIQIFLFIFLSYILKFKLKILY